MLSRLSRLSRAVPGCPACGPVASPAPDPGPRRARAAARAGLRPRDHCYASQRVSKLATRSHPLATCASERVRSIGRPPTAVAERGCHARSGSALLVVERSSSGFAYEEETYRTMRQPRMRCCLLVLRPHGAEQSPGALLPRARAGDQLAARVRAVRTISPPYPAQRASL